MNCTVDDCTKPSQRGGLCWAHHKKKLEGRPGPVAAPRGRYATPRPGALLHEAALKLADCDALEPREYRRAWQRVRYAALAYADVLKLRKEIASLRGELRQFRGEKG